jgi:hypothetical protein
MTRQTEIRKMYLIKNIVALKKCKFQKEQT